MRFWSIYLARWHEIKHGAFVLASGYYLIRLRFPLWFTVKFTIKTNTRNKLYLGIGTFYWLDSDLIPRSLEIFEKMQIFIARKNWHLQTIFERVGVFHSRDSICFLRVGVPFQSFKTSKGIISATEHAYAVKIRLLASFFKLNNGHTNFQFLKIFDNLGIKSESSNERKFPQEISSISRIDVIPEKSYRFRCSWTMIFSAVSCCVIIKLYQLQDIITW